MNRPQFLSFLVLTALFGLSNTSYGQDATPEKPNAKIDASASVEASKSPSKEVTIEVTGEAKVDASTPKSYAEDPNQSPVDKALMKALEEEFENNNQRPIGPRAQPRRPRRLAPEDVVVVDEEEPEAEWSTLKLTVSYWFAGLADDTEVRSRSGDLRNTFELNEGVSDFSENDDNGGTFVYELEIGLHRVISLYAMYYNTELESTQVLRNQNFFFKNQGFASGDNLKTRLEVTAFEGALAIHAVKTSWLKFDIFFGARYMKTELEFSRTGGGPPSKERYELVTPMVGVGLTIRPIKCFEIYGTMKLGALEYDGSSSSNSNRPRSSQTIDDRYLSFASLDAGVRLNISTGFGIGVGIRVEAFEQERFFGTRGENSIDGALGGPYASVFIGF